MPRRNRRARTRRRSIGRTVREMRAPTTQALAADLVRRGLASVAILDETGPGH